jgi:hypothetical protein
VQARLHAPNRARSHFSSVEISSSAGLRDGATQDFLTRLFEVGFKRVLRLGFDVVVGSLFMA